MRHHLLLAAIAAVAISSAAHAQDGARAYFLVPSGTNNISLTTDYVHTDVGGSSSEIGGSSFDALTLTPSYQRYVDVGGDAGTLLIGVPLGVVSGELNTGFGVIEQDNEAAAGDLFLGGSLGLVNMPALAPQEYVQHQPGFQASIATKVFLPTGDYDSTRFANLGGNRWSLQASLPMAYVLGQSLVDPSLTTLELIPSIHLFGDNDDAVGPASTFSQAPLFGLEGHVTHSFGPTVWASADAYALSGGETAFDGAGSGDEQQSLSLGATLGLVLSPSASLRLSYEEQVYSKGPITDGRRLELTSAFLF